MQKTHAQTLTTKQACVVKAKVILNFCVTIYICVISQKLDYQVNVIHMMFRQAFLTYQKLNTSPPFKDRC